MANPIRWVRRAGCVNEWQLSGRCFGSFERQECWRLPPQVNKRALRLERFRPSYKGRDEICRSVLGAENLS